MEQLATYADYRVFNISNIKQFRQMLKKYIEDKRYNYVWDEIKYFYTKRHNFLTNYQLMQLIKLSFYCNHNLFLKPLKKGIFNNDVNGYFNTIISVFLSYIEILSMQCKLQDPRFFKILFHKDQGLMSKIQNLKYQKYFTYKENNSYKVKLNMDAELRIFFKKMLKTINAILIINTIHKSQHKVICLFKQCQKIIDKIQKKYFSRLRIQFQLLKFFIIEHYNLAPHMLDLRYQFPYELVQTLYKFKQHWKKMKIQYYYSLYKKYVLMSFKYLNLSTDEIKFICQQSLILNEQLSEGSSTFHNLIKFIKKKIDKISSNNSQIQNILSRFFNTSDINISKNLSNVCQKKSQQKIKNNQIVSSNNVNNRVFQGRIRIRSQKKLTITKSQQIDDLPMKKMQDLFNQLKFNEIDILDQSSDEQYQFQSMRRKRIQQLNGRNNIKQNSQSILYEKITKQLIQPNSKTSYYQKVYDLDQVVLNIIEGNYKANKQFRSKSEYNDKLSSLKNNIQKLKIQNHNTIASLQNKQKNVFYHNIAKLQQEPIKQQVNWAINRNHIPLKIIKEKRQFLKLNVPVKKQDQQCKIKKGIHLSDSFDRLSKKINFNNAYTDEVLTNIL